MPKFRVLRDTIDSATGRIYKAGDVMDIEIPVFVQRDIRGESVLDDKGQPKTSPMKISGNLEPIVEEAAKKGKADA